MAAIRSNKKELQRQQSQGHQGKPAQQVVSCLGYSVTLSPRAARNSAEHLLRGRAHAAPDQKGLGSLFNQHAQAVTRLRAVFACPAHEGLSR
jgi:hypothetical protein